MNNADCRLGTAPLRSHTPILRDKDPLDGWGCPSSGPGAGSIQETNTGSGHFFSDRKNISSVGSRPSFWWQSPGKIFDEMEDIESTEESESKIDYVKIIKEGLLFYTTAFFVLLLICRLGKFQDKLQILAQLSFACQSVKYLHLLRQFVM